MGRDEDEYIAGQARKRNIEESIFIYEDKKVEEMSLSLKRLEQKVNLLIRMLTAHDYDTKNNKR